MVRPVTEGHSKQSLGRDLISAFSTNIPTELSSPSSGDVQYFTVHAAATGAPLNHIWYVREDSPEYVGRSDYSIDVS